ncbi:MAG: sigma-70 family RNA polymerase sigma factor [Clostridia bacterium]|nr:sigma-70 family RNA polymerase sigma factor [Clostridia bacterium]MDE6758368.1 sigma-70 family RNA polymerase sigma factor [Clostridia bacterium]MDE7079829.1 sigma-70 family RNA polymerase sigma factor [Clostridia bacterium]
MQQLNIKKINRYLSGVKRGRYSYLEKLFEYTYSNLYNVALAYVDNKSDVNDALSNAFLNVVKYIDTFDINKNGYNWMYTIVKNCAVEFNKNKCQEVDFALCEQIEDNFDVLEYVMLKQSIATLEEAEKRLIYQIYWEGYTMKEIAQNTNTPLSTLYSRLNKTYEKLRAFHK